MSLQQDMFYRYKLRIVALVPLMVFFLLCVIGTVQFELWSQVVRFWVSDFTLYEKFTHHHGFRYFLVYPIFQLAKWLGVSYNWLFSLYVPVLISLIAYFTTHAVVGMGRHTSIEKRTIIFIGVSLFIILLSLLMNGRLMFAFTGSAILVWALLNWERNRDWINLLAIVTAFFFSSVSSGTFIVVIASFYFFLGVNVLLGTPSVCRRKILVNYALLLVLVNPFLTMVLIKNFEFYGDDFSSVMGLLSHGYGLLLLQSNLIFLAVGMIAILLLTYFFRKQIFHYWVLSSLVLIYIAGGMFGYSTALVVLPPLLVITSEIVLALFDRLTDSKINPVI